MQKIMKERFRRQNREKSSQNEESKFPDSDEIKTSLLIQPELERRLKSDKVLKRNRTLTFDKLLDIVHS